MTVPIDATHKIVTDFHTAYYKRDPQYSSFWMAWVSVEDFPEDRRWFPVRLTTKQLDRLKEIVNE